MTENHISNALAGITLATLEAEMASEDISQAATRLGFPSLPFATEPRTVEESNLLCGLLINRRFPGVAVCGLRDMARAELDEYGAAGVPVASVGYTSTRRGDRDVPPTLHGWSPRWIATGGTGNCGTLVLVPGDRRTSALRHACDVSRAETAGLTSAESSAWAAQRPNPRLTQSLPKLWPWAQAIAAAPRYDGWRRWEYAWGCPRTGIASAIPSWPKLIAAAPVFAAALAGGQ